MKLSEFKSHLGKLSNLTFVQPNGNFVPRHFHITEVGLVTKHFIDCGVTIHQEQTVSMQIWVADDFDHRLKPSSLLSIIELSKKVMGNEDLEVEVEYQTETIGKYGVGFDGENFLLLPKHTDCLAKENCGVPEIKTELVEADASGSCCKPGGGCC